jgi:hypothetical protein
VNQCYLGASCQEFEVHLAAIESGSGRNIQTSTVIVKPLKFDRSMSWTVFHRWFEAMADNSSWETMEKAILEGKLSASYRVAWLKKCAKIALLC